MKQPTIILSIGEMGALAISEIKEYLLDNTSIQFGGISFNKPNSVPDNIQWYTLDASLSEFRANRFKVGEMPDIGDWFDVDQLRDADISLKPEHRQLGRLLFYQHMMADGQALESYLKNIERLVREGDDTQNSMTLQVHTLFSMDELEGLAIVLDILNLVNKALSKPPSIILHCGVPEFASQAHHRETQRHMSASYAMIRELKRFVVSYGGAPAQVYPDESPLVVWRAESARHLASSVKFYSHKNGTVAQQWSDVLLALLEGSEQELLNVYEQAHVNNPSSVISRDDRYALFVSLYGTRSAIFPVIPFRKYLIQSLHIQWLSHWLGDGTNCHDMTLSDLREVVIQKWLNKTHTTAGIRHISSPKIASLALFNDAKLNQDATLDTLLDALNISTLKDEDVNQPVFDWKIEAISVSSNHRDYLNLVDAELRRVFGTFNLDTGGQYQEKLAYIVQRQIHDFDESLQLFILDLLNNQSSFQFSCLSRLMNQFVVPELKKFQRKVDLVLRKQGQYIRRSKIADSIANKRNRVKHSKTIFGGLHADVKNYQTQLEDILRPLRTYYLWQAMMTLSNHMMDEVTRVVERIEQWSDLLWRGDDSILSIVSNEQKIDVSLADSPSRYWLFDEDWANREYQKLLKTNQDELMSHLRWFIGMDGLLSLEFKVDNAHEFNELTPNPALARQYLKSLRIPVENIVANKDFSMWKDYLNIDDRLLHHHDNLLDFFKDNRLNWDLGQHNAEYYFAIPSTVANESDLSKDIQEFIQAKINKLPNDVTIPDGTRIVLLSEYEEVPSSDLLEYQYLEESYLSLERGGQSNLHIFRPEVEAIYLQNSAYSTFKQTVQFSGDIVSLLSNRDRIEDFIQLYALRLIDSIPSKLDQHSYVLYDSDGTRYWWLPTRDSGENLYYALETYCLDTHGVQFGTSGRAEPLPREHVKEWITNRLADIDDRMQNLPQDGGLWRIINDLINYRGKQIASIVRPVGHMAEQLEHLQNKLKHELDEDLPRQDYETRLLLIVVGQDMMKNLLARLQKLG